MTHQQNKNRYRVLFSGGGTLGPVIPLLAVWDQLRSHKDVPVEGVWVATPDGPEHAILQNEKMHVYRLRAPKLRRYFSAYTLLVPLLMVSSFFRAWYILKKEKPHVLLSAGGYTSLPLHLAAWLLRIPSLVHQQDVLPGLTNRIIAPIAVSVTCAFEKTAANWQVVKPMVIGNPVRADVLRGSKVEAIRHFQLDPGLPTILVLGGGTGALDLNELICSAAPQLLSHAQIIHSTGVGKSGLPIGTARYHSFDFIPHADLAHAYAAADLIIARAGMGTMSELAAIHKPTLMAPLPHSHQELNAQIVVAAGAAEQCARTTEEFVAQVQHVLSDKNVQQKMQQAWSHVMRTDAAARLSAMVLYILARKK